MNHVLVVLRDVAGIAPQNKANASLSEVKLGKIICRPATDLPLNRKAAIGNLCVHWTMLEHEIERFTWILERKGQKDGRRITHMDGFRKRISRLEKLVGHKLRGKSRETAEALIIDIKEVYEVRNLIIHGFYGWPKNPGMRRKLQVFSFRDDPQSGEGVEATVDFLNGVTESVDILKTRCLVLHIRTSAEISRDSA